MFIKSIGEKTYDLAIVGAGPAGITLALRLAEQTRATILLIESGARESKQEILKLSEVAATGDLASNYYPLHAQRVFGGTSTVWTGFCTTMEKRAFLNNEWPIEYEDISPYYEDVADILELPKQVYQTPIKRLVGNENIVYRPYYLSQPVRFNEKYVAPLRDHQTIDVLLNNTCTKPLSNGNVIEALLLQESEGQSSAARYVKARLYVLACGGIGNAKLLQLGQIAADSPVGHYFMEHPHIYDPGVLELSKKMIDPVFLEKRVIHALQFSDEYCVKNNLLSFTVSFETSWIENRALLGETKSVYVSLPVVRAEMAARESNRISLGDRRDHLKQPTTRVNFQFNYQTQAEKIWDALARELLASGIGRATTLAASSHDITGGGHYMGTTRMGSAANTSVVDANCKVHTMDNLYITGSSIFPASGASHPTFSIVAFALRLADHLSTKLQG